MMPRVRLGTAVLLVGLLACEVAPRAGSSAGERPVEVPGRGVFVDYQWAEEPEDLVVRSRRLEAWLERYDPRAHGLEDAVHLRYWRVAQYRLLQAYYRTGRLAAADSLLELLQATDAEVR